MEPVLKKESFVFYDTRVRLSETREETCEVIVPDARQDIARIIECDGEAYLTSHELSDERVLVNGSIKAFVLYCPESGEKTGRISAVLPFSHRFDVKGTWSGVLLCTAELQSIDCRTINPRKLLIRATVRINVRVLTKETFELCSSADGEGIRELHDTVTAKIPCGAGASTFELDERFELPATKPAVEELLKCACRLSADDYSIVGQRIVYKGTMYLRVFYRAVGEGLYSHSFELPFSQICEPEGGENGEECVLRAVQKSLSVGCVDGSDGRALSVMLTAETQSVVYKTCRMKVLRDVYSTTMKSLTKIRPTEFSALAARSLKTQTVRESIDTAAPVGEILDVGILLRAVEAGHANEETQITARADLSVLYTREDGELMSAKKSVPVSLPAEGFANTSCDAAGYARSEAVSAGVSGGIELRFDACFDVAATRKEKVFAVSELQLEPYGEEDAKRPSAVLKLIGEGDSLWSLAKKYGADINDIRTVNGIDENMAPEAGRLILIPKRR